MTAPGRSDTASRLIAASPAATYRALLDPARGGTLVTVAAQNVPAGISAEDHAAGPATSLGNLAGFLA